MFDLWYSFFFSRVNFPLFFVLSVLCHFLSYLSPPPRGLTRPKKLRFGPAKWRFYPDNWREEDKGWKINRRKVSRYHMCSPNFPFPSFSLCCRFFDTVSLGRLSVLHPLVGTKHTISDKKMREREGLKEKPLPNYCYRHNPFAYLN